MDEHETAAPGHGDLDAAIADLLRLPDGTPGRPRRAAALIEAIFRTGVMPPPARANAVPALLAIAETDPPATPRWRRTCAAAEVLTLVLPAMEGRLDDPRAALVRLDRLAAEHAGDAGITAMVDSGRLALRFASAMQGGDRGAMARMPADLSDFLGNLPPGVAGGPEGELLTSLSAMVSTQQYDPATIHRMMSTVSAMPADSAVRQAVEEASADLTAFAGLAADDGVRPSDEKLATFVTHAEQPAGTPADRALRHAQAGMAALWAGRETDPARITLGLDHLRTALDLAGPGDPQRVFYLGVMATGLLRRHEVTSTVADLREAAGLLEEARAAAGGPHHSLWQQVNEELGMVRRMLGDRPDHHRAAVEGLRGTIWQVLVQPDLASATASVRRAGEEANEVARQCLVAGDPAAAVTALDAGRGLALFAATFAAAEAGTLTDHLIEAGQPELAERWQAAASAGRFSADLRRDVLTVLSARDAAAGLLDPPGYAEIQQALADLDADALVYLMPGEGIRPGHAVIAPVSGPPSFMALPGLTPDSVPQMDRYLSAVAARELGEADPVEEDLGERLAEVGGWAWDAAMRQVIEVYLPRRPRPTGRTPRIVLIPMGELARIPWQAARRPDGRYAIELIALSQTASARMLVRSAALPAVPLTATGLIVGDPPVRPSEGAAELPAARREAYSIRQAFYRGARYLGRRPDGSPSRSGRGTADEIRAWLTSPDPAAGTFLHLACHGLVRAGAERATAYLLLAADDRDRLTAEELVALLAAAPHRTVGLVVLAACRTGISLNGYDEAYSLGTAFLAGGARTVLSSQWNVPDSSTSALMFMVHRGMRVDGRPAWAALREAQLWMLDPERVIPDDMPGPLRERLAESELDSVTAWAAFIHGGQ